MNQMLKILRTRHSVRGSYDVHRRVQKEAIDQILEAARWAPTAHNMQNFEVIVIDEKSILRKLGSLTSPVSQAFIRENHALLSFSVEELQQRKVGILGTWFPRFMRDLSVKPKPGELRSAGQADLVKKNPVLLVVMYDPSKRAPASEGDTLGFMSLGCMMENMWLMAHSLGISVHIVSSFNDGSMETRAKKILGISKDLKIAFTMRLGYIDEPKRYVRVRRSVKDFTSYNKYGDSWR
jgi:nitroreductase